MGRRFASASSQYVKVAIGPASAEAFNPHTTALLLRRTTDPGADMRIFATVNAADNDGAVIYMQADNQVELWASGSSGAISTFTVVTADGWVLLVVNKASGSATPRWHKYVYATNTWTHENAGAAQTSLTTAGAGGFWHIGRGNGGAPQYFNGDYAAACYIARNTTDSEVEQLARGDWWRFSPRFWREFPSGVDRPVLGRNIGRDGTRDTISTGTRTPTSDPPGFRFSIKSRRGY